MTNVTRLFLLALAYTLAGFMGLHFAFVNASATAIWPPTGIALAALIIYGYKLWPGILLGAFIVNLGTAGNVATAATIAVGNTLEGLTAAYLVKRYAYGTESFDDAFNIFKFMVLAALASPMIAATIGALTLSFGGLAEWKDFGAIWTTWWLGDAGGTIVIAPLLILWNRPSRFRWDSKKVLEAAVTLSALMFLAWIVFGGTLPSRINHYPLEFLCTAVVVWVAFRLGQREAATAVFILALWAVIGTIHGVGPFSGINRNDALLLLQTYLGVLAFMSLAVAAERQSARDRLYEQIRKRQTQWVQSVQAWKEQASERQRVEMALEASEKRYKQLLQSNIVGTMVLDWKGRVFEANDAFLRMLGYTRQDLEDGLVGGDTMTPPEYRAMDDWARIKLLESGDCPPLEKEYFRKDGSRISVIVGVVFHEEPEQHLVCLVIDASERRKAMEALRNAFDEVETRVNQRTAELAATNEELVREVERRRRAEAAFHSLALTDSLTGLYNRRGFTTLSNQLLKQTQRSQQGFLVFLADVDGLKIINDTYGHLEGDQCIIAVATILKNVFRASDVIARLGGDEFAIAVSEDVAEISERALITRLQKNIEAFNARSRKKYKISLSIGTAELKPDQLTPINVLLDNADVKLYEQKHYKKTRGVRP